MPHYRTAPNHRTTRPVAGKRVRRGWGLLSLSALAGTLAIAGCGSIADATGSPVAADTPAATSTTASAAMSTTPDTSQPSTIDLSSPSAVAPATSAATSSAAPRPKVVAPPTHVTKPRPVTTTTTAKPSLCGAPPNPFGYNFCGRGGYIYNANPAKVCSYFNCIANFGNSPGYMIECRDHTYSTAGGRRGACSDHGGVLRPVYSG
jgi:hypothetical protein